MLEIKMVFHFDTSIKLSFVKVEGEKNYHLRVAAILGEVEAEVSSILDCLQEKTYQSK